MSLENGVGGSVLYSDAKAKSMRCNPDSAATRRMEQRTAGRFHPIAARHQPCTPEYPIIFDTLNQQRHDERKFSLLQNAASRHSITDMGRVLFSTSGRTSKSRPRTFGGSIVMWLALLHRGSDVSREEARKAIIISVQRGGRMPHISGATATKTAHKTARTLLRQS